MMLFLSITIDFIDYRTTQDPALKGFKSELKTPKKDHCLKLKTQKITSQSKASRRRYIESLTVVNICTIFLL